MRCNVRESRTLTRSFRVRSHIVLETLTLGLTEVEPAFREKGVRVVVDGRVGLLEYRGHANDCLRHTGQ